MKRLRTNRPVRRGAVAVEAAIVLPLLVAMMAGMWEVGRMVHVRQVLDTAAREGARLAAGGYTNGTAVTRSMVQQAVRDYLTAAGFPTAAVSGAVITLTPVTGSWTDPCNASPLDRFTVAVKIPSGSAFDALRWSFIPRLTSATELNVSTTWYSMIDETVVVDAVLPY